MQRCLGSVILAVAWVMPAFGQDLRAQAPGDETVVLDTSGFRRCFYTLRPPVVRKGQGVEPVRFTEEWLNRETVFPPADWTRPDFDDSSWPRVAGVFRRLERRGVGEFPPIVALACTREKFQVTDPAAVKRLTLSVAYHGGVIVYLNGTEIARGHLPQGAHVTPDALAEDYPLECHVKPDGSPLVLTLWNETEENLRRVALRSRRLENVSVPTRLLRKGVNVLAVEVHRAPYREEAVGTEKEGWRLTSIGWGTCGLAAVRLEASSGEGIVPNVARPEGVQVWNSDPLAADFDMDCGDANEPLRPISLVGTRGGTFSGKVVVGSTTPIKGLRAVMGVLRHKAGAALISPSHVQVRYGLPWGTGCEAAGRYPLPGRRFDALAEVPPDRIPVRVKKPGRQTAPVAPGQPTPVFGAVVPVWVTVRVPPDAAAGEYEGTLTIYVSHAEPVTVGVRLEVCAWKLPPPGDWHTFVEFIQSPDTLALEYDVPLWSQKHFRLIERSLRLLGQVGSASVYVPLICETNLGNAESMVRWIPRPDGTYGHDFTIMERYLDLVEKHQGKPKVVCFAVWDTFLEGGGYTGQEPYIPSDVKEDRKRHEGLGPEVTTVNAAAGKVGKVVLPKESDPRSRVLWKPLLEELRGRMRRRGLESATMLGFVSDTTPTKEVVSLFQELLPGVPWLVQGHGRRASLHGVPCACTAYVWEARFATDPGAGRSHGWARPGLDLFFPRSRMDPFPMVTQRLMAEVNIAGEQRGFGRLGADFWPVLRNPRGERIGRISEGRFPKSSWRNLNIVTAYLAPGPEGPVSTARLEMVREGLQECEARIFIEKALADETLRVRLGEDLARRSQEILDERTVDLLRGMSCFTFAEHFTGNAGSRHIWWEQAGVLGSQWFIGSLWQTRSKKLFDAAARIAKISGSN